MKIEIEIDDLVGFQFKSDENKVIRFEDMSRREQIKVLNAFANGYELFINALKIIKKAKAELLKSTNIETSEDEMKVLDNFLFRCCQMGWLDMYDGISEEEFAEQWSKFGINKAYNKIMEEKALKQYEVPTGYIKIWDLPDGYQFTDENGNIINATKIVLEKKNITREEQMDNAAQEYIDSDNSVLTYSDGFCEQTDHPFVRAAFKAGVEWADKTMIEKACEWLYIYYPTLERSKSAEDAWDKFKKAMEEQR